MPKYSFLCESCGKSFHIDCSIKDYCDTKIVCAHCNSDNISRDFQSDISSSYFSIKKHDSELKTIGDLANRNSERFSEDKKNYLFNKHNEYRKDEHGKLPEGMTRIKKTKKINWSKNGK